MLFALRFAVIHDVRASVHFVTQSNPHIPEKLLNGRNGSVISSFCGHLDAYGSKTEKTRIQTNLCGSSTQCKRFCDRPQYFVGKMHAISDENWFVQRNIYCSLRRGRGVGSLTFSHPYPHVLPLPC